MLAIKEEVRYELEKLKSLFNELMEYAEGGRPQIQKDEDLPDDFKLHINNNTYLVGNITDIDVSKLEACIARVNTEMKNLLKAVKRKL